MIVGDFRERFPKDANSLFISAGVGRHSMRCRFHFTEIVQFQQWHTITNVLQTKARSSTAINLDLLSFYRALMIPGS